MSIHDVSASREIDAIIGKVGGWRGETLADLRRVILSADADIVEEIKWRKPSRPEGVATWVCNGNVCIADLLKNSVRLTFFKGPRIEDPTKLFNTRLESNAARAIDVVEGMRIDEDAFRALVRRAVAANRGP